MNSAIDGMYANHEHDNDAIAALIPSDPSRPLSVLKCVDCGRTYDLNDPIYTCPNCNGLLDIDHDLDRLRPHVSRALFDSRLNALDMPYNSGVWRFKELVFPGAPNDKVVTRGEGNTTLYRAPKGLAAWIGANQLALKHEGENPTGSFKDRGMTGGVTHAVLAGATSVVCASTGNTSASMASFAALAGLQALVFFPYGSVAAGKLAQSIAYGALSVQVRGDFDACLDLVRQSCRQFGIYLLNSVNPFRLEGQKTIVFEMLQQRRWKVPDWIVLPGGNLGNTSAFGKGLHELHALGLIDKLPRIAVIQAEGASPFYASYRDDFRERKTMKADTLATAIKIGNPASYYKAKRTLEWTNGVVESVTDQEILDAKAQIDRCGIGCEPASAASVAGVKKLLAAGTIHPDDDVVTILTGHVLKDPEIVMKYHSDTLEGFTGTYANRLLTIEPTLEAVRALLNAEHVSAL
jgi:threonine synthase